MACQVPSLEPSSTRISSNVTPVRFEYIGDCPVQRRDIAFFIHRGHDHAQSRSDRLAGR